MIRTPDLSLQNMMDEGGVIRAMEKNLSSQVVDGNVEICSLSNGLSSQFSSYPGEFEKENGSVDANTVSTTTMVTGLHELLMLAEEFESEEVTERKQAEEKAIVQDSTDTSFEAYDDRKHQSEVHDSSIGQSNGAHEEKNEVSKGNGSISNLHLTDLKSHRPSSSVLGKGGNGCSQMQKSRLFHPTTSVKGVVKVTTRGSIDLSSHGNMGEKSQLEHVEVTVSAADSSVHQPTKNGTTRLKYTVPQPFALATDKRASTGVRPVDVAASDVNRRMGARGAPSSSVPKKDKMYAKLDTQAACNPLLSENIHLHDQNVNPPMQVNTKHEEDADSVFSSTASAKSTRDSKGKSSSAPGAVFSFRCNERAEKRKEFFTKVEAKLSAKEAEIDQLQVKKKELQEVEIKMLRKSLTFKASPMPSFYHEAAPAKVELKKIPLTRPKSPKLGRRKSYAGVESESNPSQVCTTSRFSLDQKKSNEYLQNHTGEEHMKTTADKDMAGKRTAGRSLKKVSSEKSLTTSSERSFSPKPEISNSSKEGLVDESTKDGNLITSTDSNNSSGRRSNMNGLILQISVAVEGQEDAKPLDGKNGIASTAIDRDTETLQNSEVVEEANGIESINRKNEIAKTTGVGITVQKPEAVEELIEAKISGGKNKMEETKVQGDILEDSGSLIDTSEDSNSRSGFVTGVLAENLQGTDGLHLESESHSRVNPRKGRIQGNNTNMKQMEPKFVRSSQQGSAEETNGKGVKNPRREQLKAMAPYFKNSKRENGRTTSSKKIGKGNDNMIRTMSDVSVQS